MSVLDKEIHKKINERNFSNERVEVIETDELYSFIERKNRIYVITLVSREKRQIVGYDIAFDKSRKRTQNLVNSSVKANIYYTDSYSSYSERPYGGLHTSLKNKSQIYTVEGVNSDLRHCIPLLRRKSKCFLDLLKQPNLYLRFLSMLLIISLSISTCVLLTNLLYSSLLLFDLYLLGTALHFAESSLF